MVKTTLLCCRDAVTASERGVALKAELQLVTGFL